MAKEESATFLIEAEITVTFSVSIEVDALTIEGAKQKALKSLQGDNLNFCDETSREVDISSAEQLDDD
jgi:hypothetical protein